MLAYFAGSLAVHLGLLRCSQIVGAAPTRENRETPEPQTAPGSQDEGHEATPVEELCCATEDRRITNRVSVTFPEPHRGLKAGDGLDMAIIGRYIKHDANKLQYCYGKQLLAKPGLAGDIQAAFFIMPDGSVKSSTAAGFDGEVASCVAGVISTIEFPKPTDGGGVMVYYPLTFHAMGS